MKLNNFLPFFALAGHALASPKQETIEVDVCIVGGGATGAYAAVRLREDYKKKVVVIEKANRLVSSTKTEEIPLLTRS
ncbi:hypothetical protein FVER14953_20802 [Fusarium verticillioides]|nr:hypothetical protein FVER14953_20802 [Fusarium verticillioides]